MTKTFTYPDAKHNLEVPDKTVLIMLNNLVDELCSSGYYRDRDTDEDFIYDGDNKPLVLRRQIQRNRNYFKPSRKEKLSKPFFEKYEPWNDVYCKGYLSYLMYCWKLDLGIEIAPCYIWNVILWRLAKIVNENPEDYRSIFTTSDDKITFEFEADTFNPNQFFEAVKQKMPTDTDCWFPDFDYKPENYDLSMKGLFAEAVQKYYGCIIFGCGIPKVRLIGDENEWSKIIDAIDQIPIKHAYKKKARDIVQQMIKNLDNPEYWSKEFFTGTRCGSGSQTEYGGSIIGLSDARDTVDEVPCILSKFPFEKKVGMDSSIPCNHRSGIMSAKIDSEGIAVPKYDQRVMVPDAEYGKMSAQERSECIFEYRFLKAANAIKERNKKVIRKFYKKLHNYDMLKIATGNSGSSEEERTNNAREFWTKLVNHRSAKAKRAERFVVENLPYILESKGADHFFSHLFHFRGTISLPIYVSLHKLFEEKFGKDSLEEQKIKKTYYIPFTDEEVQRFVEEEIAWKLRSNL